MSRSKGGKRKGDKPKYKPTPRGYGKLRKGNRRPSTTTGAEDVVAVEDVEGGGGQTGGGGGSYP